MSKKASKHPVQRPIPFASYAGDGGGDDSWYVYLLSSQDCTAFKAGFSCNPLQRIHSFNRRYYERFNLNESLLLRVDTERQARAIEAEIKSLLAASQFACPEWVSIDAGGDTEWFSAVEFSDAVAQLRLWSSDDPTRVSTVDDNIRDQLQRMSGAFELWASDYARRLQNDLESASLGYARTVMAEPLRDWLDAYRSFDIPLFIDDAETLSFVTASVRIPSTII
jgi:predicted GIY-YIG superfamily endonuclease